MHDRVSKVDYVSLAAFRRSLRKFLRFSEARARDAGLTPQQHQVLLAIRGRADRDWMTVGEIADSLQLQHHATVGLVDRSESAGLVQRARDPKDRRVVRVSLTPRGEEVLERITKQNLAELRALHDLADALEVLRGPDGNLQPELGDR